MNPWDRPGYLVKRVQDLLHREMADALATQSLGVSEYAVLTALDARPGQSNAGLARAAFVTPQSMHTVLAGLEGRGLVRRDADPANARVLLAELTARGKRVLDRAEPLVTGVEDRMLAGLTAQQVRQLTASLAACADALASRA